MFDIITFGSATRDIFLRTKHFLIDDFDVQNPGREICLPFGLKIDIDEVHFHSGGGGTNTAVTFSNQGLKTAFCGILGKDCHGEEIFRDLKKRGVDCHFIVRTNEKPTDLSVILSAPKERTILVYRGVSGEWQKKDIPWTKISQARWFYLAPFIAGKEGLFEEIVDFARKNKIRVMANPSSSFVNLPLKKTRALLKKIDILLLNQEEAQALIKNSRLSGQELMLTVKKEFPGILLITNGHQRAFLSQKNKIYSVLPFAAKTVDKTGAGDAFGSGFLAGYLESRGDMIYSTQAALANSIACFSQWGAKEGLLKKGQPFKKAKITTHEIA
ncbi:MAG: carbohydrate kinase family protein [Candidatus Nealsonbacteria bacterium]